MAAPNDEYEGVPLVQRTAERFARREFLKHGGKVTLQPRLRGGCWAPVTSRGRPVPRGSGQPQEERRRVCSRMGRSRST